MVKTNIQTFTGEVEILSNLHVGSYLTANGDASNVLDITGNVGASFFVGDGGLISNIATTLSDIVNQGNLVANVVQFTAPPAVYGGVGIVTASNVGIQNANPLHTLSIADKIIIDKDVSEPSTTMNIHGKVYASRFEGDGGLLSNIATTLESIVNQGNVSANVIKFSSATDYAGVGMVTDSNVGIQNTAPVFNLSVGSNVHIDDEGSNVLTVHGNVSVSNLNLGVFTVTASHGLDQVCAESNVVIRPVQFSNVITGISAVSNIESAGTFISTDAERGIDVSSNIDIGGRLKFDTNVFVDTLRIADVASNIVTYDRATGELTDSMGTFLNKFAVVSEQPPSDLFANATTVTNHGAYTLTTSNLATNSNTFNAFDGTANAWVSGGLAGGYIGGANVFHENNLTQLSNLHPTQFGDWLAIEFPYKTKLRHLKLTPLTIAQFPASANLYATNNDITWSEIKYWKDVVPASDTAVQTVTVDASEDFKKYALVATKAAGESSNVAIQDWQLFTESFSIDGGKVAMATSAVSGGETVMDQHGPHLRGAAVLKKYPEILFDINKVDVFGNSNAYTQAGYEISSTSRFSTSYDVLSAFNGIHTVDHSASKSSAYSTSSPFNYTLFTNNVTDKDNTQYTGEEIKLKIPHKIKLSKLHIVSYVGASGRKVASGHIFGSNTGANGSWTKLTDFSGLNTATSGHETVSVSTTDYYEWYSLVVTNLNGGEALLNIYELEYYGYEEGAGSQGDTSIDTTFTSVMNTPQTTGANVYVDGSLGGNANTNRVVGPAAANTAATYDTTGKYWELNGTLTSNISVEANTFLEGDQPHAVSVWFNSSNLEANVSNTCVFSISDQEKLDSVNLDLQSNTWHNLTYAYQGEGGSRVTYLDGRKVAEDQAEDTFGDYPPFAMTGYSQGGYMASASSDLGSTYHAWKVFDNSTTELWICDDYNSDGTTPRYTSPITSNGGGIYQGPNSTGSIPITGSGSETINGEYIQIEFPYKFKLEDIAYQREGSNWGYNRLPHSGSIVACNDGINWKTIHNWTGLTDADVGSTDGSNLAVTQAPFRSGIFAVDKNSSTYDAYKFFRIICTRIQKTDSGGDGSNYGLWSIIQLEFYGHRENDLVRLPDPTNVLKYPHIAMTGPARRGYVVSASNDSPSNGRDAWRAFNNSTSDAWSTGYTNGYSGTTPFGATANAPLFEGVRGDYIKLELPHKLIVSQIEQNGSTVRRAAKANLYGSNNDTDWVLIKENFTVPNTNPAKADINATEGYKYLVFQVLNLTGSDSSTNALIFIYYINFFGTEEGSVPLQIGGGNIDRVANFRVYDKFVGEDQALEIWDAQKDHFGRAKSSMTLYKGRLGLGTTEPEGRLAVADEPHAPEEFPPRAMTGYKTYFEGHGEFRVNQSTWWGPGGGSTTLPMSGSGFNSGHLPGYGYNAFNKRSDRGWVSISGVYTNATGFANSDSKGRFGVLGEWLEIKMPSKIKLKHFTLSLNHDNQDSVGYNTSRFPKQFTLYKSNDGVTWTSTDYTSPSENGPGGGPVLGDYGREITYNANESESFMYYVILVKQTWSASYSTDPSSHTAIAEWKLFGTREQGQSVLHDGQLTLTKNLNVPRIGPALDADDTPRRDRLVVEYNTSTNPTFEGAVRDTSGRGLDGMFVNQTHYDATQKALVFDGVDDRILTRLQNPAGESLFSGSLWFKTNTATQQGLVWIGSEGAGKAFVFKYNGDVATPNFEFSFYGNDCLYNYTLTFGTCYHIAFAYSGGTASSAKSVWVNGTEVALASQSSTTALNLDANAELLIGDRPNNGADLNGTLSNFKLYDTALTAEEVKTLYDMGRCDEGHHVVNFSKTRVGIGLGDGEVPQAALDVRGDIIGGCPVYFGATSTAYRYASSTGTVIIFDSLIKSRGGGYDTSTGRFTVPLAGTYRFDFYARQHGSTSAYSRLRINGTAQQFGRCYFGEASVMVSLAAIHELNVGDIVDIIMQEDTSARITNQYNGFIGQYISSL